MRSLPRLVAFGLCLALVAPPAGAVDDQAQPWTPDLAARPGETRAAALRRARLEKLEHLVAPRQNRIERTLVRWEKGESRSLLAFNWKGLYPALGVLASGSRLAGGARFWRPNLAATPVDLHASAFYSLKSYRYFDLQIGQIPHQRSRLPPRLTKQDDLSELGTVRREPDRLGFGFLSASFRDYPEEEFYGLGTDTSRDGRSNFRNRQTHLEAVGGYEFGSFLALRFGASHIDPDVDPGGNNDIPSIEEVHDDGGAPGLLDQPDFFRLSLLASLDLRDEPFNPHRGIYLALGASRFDQSDGSSFDFQRLALDARAYLPLGSEQRVLAARAFLSHDRPDAGSRVPFYLMETLGGGMQMRGYAGLRFRDEKVLMLEVEYRWEANEKIEAALFADFAKATAADASFAAVDFRATYGFGIRFKAPTAVLLRLEAGFSDERDRFFIRAGPSF